MKRLLVLSMTFKLLGYCGAAYGQGFDSHWIFGEGLHVEFIDEIPYVHPPIDSFNAFEACGTIANSNGQLILYTNNISYYDATHNLIAESVFEDPLDLGHFGSSKTNGSIILPWPGDTIDKRFAAIVTDELTNKARFYVFESTSCFSSPQVLEDFAGLSIWSSSINEAITAVRHANGRDWWVTARTRNDGEDSLLLALLTPQGVSQRKSILFPFETGIGGEMCYSPNGEFLAIVCGTFSVGKNIAMFEFDRCEGSIKFIDTLSLGSGRTYGLSFSKNSTKLYASTIYRPSVYVISLAGNVLVDSLIFRFPSTDIGTIQGGQLQLGPDGKIYWTLVRSGSPLILPEYGYHLPTINNPDLSLAYCDFDTFGLFLNGLPTNQNYSLPNFANYDLGPLVGSPCDTLSPQDTTQTSIEPVLSTQGEWSITPSISSGWYQLNSTNEGWLLVHDLYGREVVRRWFSGTTPFDLKGLPAGLYVATVAIDGSLERKVQRLLKQ